MKYAKEQKTKQDGKVSVNLEIDWLKLFCFEERQEKKGENKWIVSEDCGTI